MSVTHDFLVIQAKLVGDRRATLVVGRPDTTSKKIVVANTFTGAEAFRLYDKLVLPNVDLLSRHVAVDQELQLLVKRYGKEAVLKAAEALKEKEENHG